MLEFEQPKKILVEANNVVLSIKRKYSVVLDGSADLNGVYGLCKGMELVDVPEVYYRNIKVTHVTPPNEFKNKMRPNGIMKNL